MNGGWSLITKQPDSEIMRKRLEDLNNAYMDIEDGLIQVFRYLRINNRLNGQDEAILRNRVGEMAAIISASKREFLSVWKNEWP